MAAEWRCVDWTHCSTSFFFSSFLTPKCNVINPLHPLSVLTSIMMVHFADLGLFSFQDWISKAALVCIIVSGATNEQRKEKWGRDKKKQRRRVCRRRYNRAANRPAIPFLTRSPCDSILGRIINKATFNIQRLLRYQYNQTQESLLLFLIWCQVLARLHKLFYCCEYCVDHTVQVIKWSKWVQWLKLLEATPTTLCPRWWCSCRRLINWAWIGSYSPFAR